MTSKQRAYLRKLAQKLDPVVQIGKGGVTPEVVASVNEVLEARELIKATVLDNCFEEVRDVANTVGERARAEVVQLILAISIFQNYSYISSWNSTITICVSISIAIYAQIFK